MKTEYVCYTRDDLEQIIKTYARMQIIGSFFVGKIGPQRVRWMDDGSVEVLSEYLRGELPKMEPSAKKRRRTAS